MKDPWIPTQDEIVAWAGDPASQEPMEDWDLVVLIQAPNARTYLQLAANDGCPKQEYFLHVLYLLVGDAVFVFNGGGSLDIPRLEVVIAQGDEYPHRDIVSWQIRSRELLRHPETFEYEAWCSYGFAGESSPISKRRPPEP
jgi:hypothetical protein